MSQLLLNSACELQEHYRTLYRLADYYVQNDTLDKLFVVVPTSRLVRELEAKIIKDYYQIHRKPAPKVHLFNLSGLVSHCFGKLFPKSKFFTMSDAYRLVMFEESIEKSELKYFVQKNVKISHIVLKRLADVIYGIKEDGVTVDDLKNDYSRSLDDNEIQFDTRKIGDLIEIYDNYEQLCGENIIDPPDKITKILEKVNSENEINKFALFAEKFDLGSVLPEDAIIFVDLFSEFKEPEIKFLELFAHSKVKTVVKIDYSSKNGPLFGNLENTVNSLSAAGYRIKPIQTEDEQKQFDNATLFRRYLFSNDASIRVNPDLSKNIKIYQAETRSDEVRAIAKLVKYLIIKKNFKPSDICISSRSPEIYSQIIREVFAQYKIPVNIMDRHTLSSSNVITAVFSILDLISKGYRRKDLQKALLNGYINFSNDKNIIDGMNLINVSTQLRITGGRTGKGLNEWKFVLENSIAGNETRLKNFYGSDDEQSFEIYNLEKLIKDLKKAKLDFEQIVDLVDIKIKKMKIDDFVKYIKEKISALSIINTIRVNFNTTLANKKYSKADVSHIEYIEGEAKALNEFIKALDEFQNVYNKRYPGKVYDFDELYEMLKIIVQGKKYQITEKTGYGVLVTSIEQIRGLNFEAAILCGAIDGEFPMKYIPEVFLGKELPETEQKHIHSERILFYQFLTNNPVALNDNTKLTYIFYPRLNVSDEFVPSSFIENLIKIIGDVQQTKVINLSELQKDNPELKALYPEESFWINSIASEYDALDYYVSMMKKNADETATEEFAPSFSPLFKRSLELAALYNDYQKSHLENEIIEKSKLSETENEKFDKITDKPYSITELEIFAKCPYKYLVEKLYRIKQPEQIDMGMTSYEKGSLLHNIVYQFYKELQNAVVSDNALKQVVLDAQKFDEYKELLLKIGENQFSNYNVNNPYFDLEKDSILGNEKSDGLLVKWLKAEICKLEQGWNFAPALFEYEFGSSGKSKGESNTGEVKLSENIRIRGKIDRVEIQQSSAGTDFIVSDYKLNKSTAASVLDIQKGLSFQMPVYAIATKQFLESEYGTAAQSKGGVYYVFNHKVKDKEQFYKYAFATVDSGLPSIHKKSPESSDGLELLFADTIDRIIDIDEKIHKMEFPADYKSKACIYCSFANVCRKGEKDLLLQFGKEESAEE